MDSLDPFSEGIVFSVRPPKKSWKNISNLSGGEKTLSSLALVFALHYYKVSNSKSDPGVYNLLNASLMNNILLKFEIRELF